nr:hypothetical protein Cplu_177 [Cedratvirus plubellavi]
MQSLANLSLNKFSYEQLYNMCFAEGSSFGSVFDCRWDVWRSKAQADFGISPQFFDLVRNFASNGIRSLSGPQRYLQVASYVKLSPLSAIRVYDDGRIEGVYEAIKGFEMARARGDDEALLFFGRRATEQGKGDYYQRRTVQGANHPRRSIDDDSDLGELKWAVLTGDVGTLDDMIHDFFDLPVGFRISDIPRRRFWEPVLELDLPLANWRDEYQKKELFENALESGDMRIIDFFMSVFRNRNLYKWARKRYFGWGLFIKGQPEDAYAFTLRFADRILQEGFEHELDYMVELPLYFLDFSKEENQAFLPIEAYGNIPYLTVLLPLLNPKKLDTPWTLQTIINKRDEYPLSVKLVRDRMKEL